jgi:hypothetical protein
MAKLMPKSTPEFHEVAPNLAAGHHIDRLHDAKQNGKPQRQRHEDEVIKRGNRELQASKFDNIHDRFQFSLP